MKKAVYFPLRFYSTFLVVTLVVYAFGPWPWPSRHYWAVYVYMALVLLAMNVGYRFGAAKRYGIYTGRTSAIHLYRIGLYLSLLLFFPTLLWRTGGEYEFSLELLLNPAVAYMKSHDIDNFSGTAWVEYIRIILTVYLGMVLPLLIVFWEKLSISDRVLGVLAVLMELFLWLAIGTNKGIGDLVVGIFWMFVLRAKSGFTLKSILKISLAASPILFLFAAFFTLGQIGRHDGFGVQTELHSIDITADRENIFIRNLPEVAQDGAIALSSYMAQGYHGLALSFDEPFVFTWGVGHSRFLASYSDKYLGTDVEKTTYPARVEKSTGFDSKVRWHTMFPWWASDITFTGAVLLILFFAYFFALAWKDSVHSRNPYAISLSLQFLVFFSYMSANNQVFQSGPGVIGFLMTFVAWIRTRK